MNAGATLGRLSVVVPVGPGDALAPALRDQLAQLPAGAEIRVVFAHEQDAGAFDEGPTPDGPNWRSQVAPPGRAVQQNAGAHGAKGDWLWFLHADSRLSDRTLPALAAFVHANRPALGYFDLRFLDDGPLLMRLNTMGARVRSRWLGLPFGDQGLVLPRSAFDALGGFDATLRCGEDHDLVWRARRAGLVLRALHAPLYTSARKYAERGWLRTTAWTLAETWRQARRFGPRRDRP